MAKRKIEENVQTNGASTVKKNKKESIVSIIICILIALAIWVYAKNVELKNEAAQTPVGGEPQTAQTSADSAEG